MRTGSFAIAILSTLLAITSACGDGKRSDHDNDNDNKQSEAPPPVTSPLDNRAPALGSPADTPDKGEPTAPGPVTRAMGADKIVAFNYVYGKGAGAYKKVEVARKSGDWPAVQEACEDVLARDAWHLDAHRDLAIALVRAGRADAALEHFDIALAGDWLAWGPTLEHDSALADFWTTDAGREVAALNRAYGEEFLARAHAGIWLLGRRTRYKRPSESGEQWSATRGELFSYDEETRRYLRISHTRERVAGWLRSPSGDEIAWVGYWQVVLPETAAKPAARPIFRRTLVGVLDAKTLLPIGETAILREDISRVDLQYQYSARDQPHEPHQAHPLIVSVYAPDSPWGYSGDYSGDQSGDSGRPSARYTLDRNAAKLRKTELEPGDGVMLSMTLEKTWTEKTWTTEPETATGYEVTDGEDGEVLVLEGSDQNVPLPEDVMVTSVSTSPDKAYALVTTVNEPCTEPPSGSLYVLETASGELNLLLRGNSEFTSRWLDDHRFVYEDDRGRLRIHDVAQGAQVEQLKNSATLALIGLGATQGILCAR